MKPISTNFDTNRIVERMLQRQSYHPVDTEQHRGHGRRQLRNLPINRLRQTDADAA